MAKLAARRLTAAITALSLAFTSVAPVHAQGSNLSRSEYEQCQTQDEQAFRDAIRQITLDTLKQGTATIDYAALVRDQWRKHKLADVIDNRVDFAVTEVREETSWGQLLKSLAYRDKAKELAGAVAERVYRSDAMKAAIETMAIGVGQEIGRTMELTTADAARPAQRCLQAFLGPRYGRAIARSVIRDTGAAFKVSADDNAAEITSGSVVKNASAGIAGAVILLVRRQLSRMAQRLGQRVVGSVLGRLVAVVAGGVGLVLIAKDVWDLRYGVLPIIADEMKSEATKAKVREELSLAIKEQISQQVEVLSDSTSDRIVDIWRDFKRTHVKVLELTDKNTKFKSFVDVVRPDHLPRLNEIVGLILKRDQETGVIERLNNGTLQRALNRLTGPGLQIARELNSVDGALQWALLAPDKLDKLVAHEIHKRAQPDQFSKSSLGRVLSMDDDLVIKRLVAIKREARDVLFDLGDDKVARLARGMEAQELNTLASYITGLGASARMVVLTTIAESPARMRVLSSSRVRDAVLSSRDQDAAVAMMLRADKGINIKTINSDLALVLDRRVNPVLMWDKHPIIVTLAGVLAILLLLILRRLFFRPRRAAARTNA
ncbi:MAG: hypothetical protein ACR2PA_04065 [Hyphomicrobiaceae bacterium]